MTNRLHILIGIFVLFFGVLFYLVERPPEQTQFLEPCGVSLSLYGVVPRFFGPFGSNLPAFIHVFSFSHLTAGFLYCRRRGYLVICLSWFLVGCVFELGQRFKLFSTTLVPDWFSRIPVLEKTKSYLLFGTFDMADLAATAFGAVAAYFVLINTAKERSSS